MYQAQRDPDPSWVAELATISAPQDLLSHLELWWEPGHRWGPVQRWVLYELIPVQAITRKEEREDLHMVFTELRPCACPTDWTALDAATQPLADAGDRVPASQAQCPVCGGRRGLGFARIHRTYHERGYYAQPFWVIQGSHGGHKLSFNTEEAALAQARGLPTRPPVPGSLPYAPWDHRVASAIRAYDRTLTLLASLRSAHSEERERLTRAARAAQEAYLDGIFLEIAETTPRLNLDEIPRGDYTLPMGNDEARARYIETGVT